MRSEEEEKMLDALSTNVKISFVQVAIIVVNNLIARRNRADNEKQKAFDIVLRCYLDDNEFKRFVIDGEEVS